MEVLTTPENQFNNLPDYPFEANYVPIDKQLKMHYVDEGDKNAPVVLMLHGEPSWSFLYRKMIPVFVNAGYRAIAPDLIGFGKSDKPTQMSDYTYEKHLKWMQSFIDKTAIDNIHLFCQDWGGLLGLRLAVENDSKFKSIVAANTILPTGDGKPNDAFTKWQKYSQESPVFDIGKIISKATVTDLSPKVIAAYNAPFPDDTYKAGARIFPSLVPTTSDDPQSMPNKMAWAKLMKWEKPFLTLFSDSDPIMKGLEKLFHKMVPGCKNQRHTIIEGGGHFLQEDKGEEIAEKCVEFLKNIQ